MDNADGSGAVHIRSQRDDRYGNTFRNTSLLSHHLHDVIALLVAVDMEVHYQLVQFVNINIIQSTDLRLLNACSF